MTSPEGEVIVYTYDRARRLNSITRNSITQATYVYNKLGQRTNLYFGPNQTGAHTDYGYDNTTRWLTSVSNITSTGTASSFTYTLDKTGQRTKMTYANGDAVSYAYDNAYHLTGETRTGSISYTNAFTYDDVGNRTQLNQNYGTTVTNSTYNNGNQLISEICGITTTYYAYDANGNQIRKGDGSSITYTWTYNYDNRIISYYDPLTSSNNTTYTTDALGRRICKVVTGSQVLTSKSFYDGANCIADYDLNNVPKSQYVTPFLDDNLVLSRNNATYYYLHDGLGSVRNLIDTNQVTKNSYDYMAFGEPLNFTSTVGQKFTFAGREYDSETGTHYLRWRNDDPKTGRFLGRDPRGYDAGINIYTYCGDDPVNYVDPWGLWKIRRDSRYKRAIAIPNKESDTITTLGQEIGLDPAESGKWLRVWSGVLPENLDLGPLGLAGLFMDTKSYTSPEHYNTICSSFIGNDDKLTTHKWVFTIPNTIVSGIGKTKDKSEEENWLSVLSSEKSGLEGYFFNNTHDLLGGINNNPDLVGFIYIVHGEFDWIYDKGNRVGATWAGKLWYDTEENNGVIKNVYITSDKVNLNHKLALLRLISCGSYNSGNWSRFVSPYGHWVLSNGLYWWDKNNKSNRMEGVGPIKNPVGNQLSQEDFDYCKKTFP